MRSKRESPLSEAETARFRGRNRAAAGRCAIWLLPAMPRTVRSQGFRCRKAYYNRSLFRLYVFSPTPSEYVSFFYISIRMQALSLPIAGRSTQTRSRSIRHRYRWNSCAISCKARLSIRLKGQRLQWTYRRAKGISLKPILLFMGLPRSTTSSSNSELYESSRGLFLKSCLFPHMESPTQSTNVCSLTHVCLAAG